MTSPVESFLSYVPLFPVFVPLLWRLRASWLAPSSSRALFPSSEIVSSPQTLASIAPNLRYSIVSNALQSMAYGKARNHTRTRRGRSDFDVSERRGRNPGNQRMKVEGFKAAPGRGSSLVGIVRAFLQTSVRQTSFGLRPTFPPNPDRPMSAPSILRFLSRIPPLSSHFSFHAISTTGRTSITLLICEPNE